MNDNPVDEIDVVGDDSRIDAAFAELQSRRSRTTDLDAAYRSIAVTANERSGRSGRSGFGGLGILVAAAGLLLVVFMGVWFLGDSNQTVEIPAAASNPTVPAASTSVPTAVPTTVRTTTVPTVEPPEPDLVTTSPLSDQHYETPEEAIARDVAESFEYIGACPNPAPPFDESRWCSMDVGLRDDGLLRDFLLMQVGDEIAWAGVALREYNQGWRVARSFSIGTSQSDAAGNHYDLTQGPLPTSLYLNILDHFAGFPELFPLVEGWCHAMADETGELYAAGRCLRPDKSAYPAASGQFFVELTHEDGTEATVAFSEDGDLWRVGL